MPELETPVAAQSDASQGPTFKERINALSGDAREHWQLEGDIDRAEALMKPKEEIDAKADPSPADDEPEPSADEAGTGTTEPEPGPGVKVKEPPKGARQSWGELREAKARAEAKSELLEQQLAQMRNSPAATKGEPRAEAKPIVSDRPDFPDLDKFQTVAAYNEAVKQWKVADQQWIDARLEERFGRQAEQQQFKAASDKWETIKDAGRTKYKDFETVAFNPKIPASLPAIVELQAHPNGHEIMYHLGKNPEIAAKLAESTDIPGNFKTYAEMMARSAKDPAFALLLGEKRGIAKAEIARLAETLSKPKGTPLKETIARQPKPSGEVAVEGHASPIDDELTDAIKRKDQRAYARIMNKREMQEAGV